MSIHFLDPLNVGVIANPDGTGLVGDLACGDMMVMTIRVLSLISGRRHSPP